MYMTSFAYSHSKFESIVVHLVFKIILCLVLLMSCGELILILQYMYCWKSQCMTNLMCDIIIICK